MSTGVDIGILTIEKKLSVWSETKSIPVVENFVGYRLVKNDFFYATFSGDNYNSKIEKFLVAEDIFQIISAC